VTGACVVKSKDALGVLEGQSVMDLFFLFFFVTNGLNCWNRW